LTIGSTSLVADFSRFAPRDTVQLQSQYSTRLDNHQLFVGAVYFDGQDAVDFTRSSFFIDELGTRLPISLEDRAALDEVDAQFSQQFDTQRDLKFYSAYIDDSWFVSEQLTIQTAIYLEDFDNGTTDRSEVNPRLGIVWSPSEKNTFRLAGFRYLLPPVQSRLHPTHVGGVFITRNTEEGVLIEEIDLVWEHKWANGMLSFNVFDLDGENRERAAGQSESVSRSKLDGTSIALNQQLGNRFGLSASIAVSEIRDGFVILQANRDEVNTVISLNYVSPKGITAGLSQGYRSIDFVGSSRADESISITDFNLGYTFRDRQASIGLTITNLFDNEFNWVTDAFTTTGRDPARQVLVSGSWNF
jgi:hypothetical protein